MPLREPTKFQFQLAQTNNLDGTCIKCVQPILIEKDHEHVILWPPNKKEPWLMHIPCFEEVIMGAMTFYQEFVLAKSKKEKIH